MCWCATAVAAVGTASTALTQAEGGKIDRG